MNDSYWLFVVMVIATVCSPGPGVLMTIDNAITRGWRSSMFGVLGLAIGAAVMAGLTSAGIGILIRSSQPLFLLLKYFGVSYLFYLSYITWRRAFHPALVKRKTAMPGSTPHAGGGNLSDARRRLLLRGALLQTSNPSSLLFFLSVLPQVAGGPGDGTGQALRLALAIGTYCIVLLLLHALYAGLAARARTWLSRPDTTSALAGLSAIMFFIFGVRMLTLEL